MSITVHTQAELDEAISAHADEIIIDSGAGVWLTLADSCPSRVVARGFSSVEARGSSSLVARDSSHVKAWGSSSVSAWDSSRVDAGGSSRVVAWGGIFGASHVVALGSSCIVARGSSSVLAHMSARVEARDSSSVVARGSSRVVARDFSRVEARGSSRVVAWDSSRVVAWDSSSVEAGRFVAVHLHSQSVTLSGGVAIDMTELDLADVSMWLSCHGVRDAGDGEVILFKAVDADYQAGPRRSRLKTYLPGETVIAPDWKPTQDSGNGLLFGLSPMIAEPTSAAHYLACAVPIEALIPLGDEAKARSCRVLYEVDWFGDRIEEADDE